MANCARVRLVASLSLAWSEARVPYPQPQQLYSQEFITGLESPVMIRRQRRFGVAGATLRAAAAFVVLGIVCPGSPVAAERPSRKTTPQRSLRSTTDAQPVPVDVPALRMRVETPEGVLVIYDAASPPQVGEGCSGYLAYWLSTPDMTPYVFPAVLHEQGDLVTPLLALERDLGVDLEALADSDDRVDAARSASAEAPNEEIVWGPATLRRAVEIMGFDPGDDSNLPEPDDGQTAMACGPCMASLGPPSNCGSPGGLGREALNVAAGCCGGGGCTGPCCSDPWCCGDPCCWNPCSCDPCCGSPDPCCGSNNHCCGSSDPCCGVGPAHGPIRHAKVGGTGSDCLSWTTACTLNNALTQAQSGDEVWVAAGTYRPAGAGGDREATFQLKNGVAIYGGFAGTECLRDLRNPAVNVTILSGDLNRDDACTVPVTSNCCSAHQQARCDDLQTGQPECADLVCSLAEMEWCCIEESWPIQAWHQGCADAAKQVCGCLCVAGGPAENTYHVVTATDTDATAVLDGFTITAGHASGSQTADASDPNLLLSGAGAYVANASPTFIGCTFLTNVASRNGGAVYIKNGSPLLMNCVLSDNSAGGLGGGVYIDGSSDGGSPRFGGCTFNGNKAPSGYGGGFYNIGGKPTLTNCVFVGNETLMAGGGIYSAGSTSPGTTLVGCSFTENTSTEGAGVGLSGLDIANLDGSHTVIRTVATLRGCSFTNNEFGIGSGVGGGGLSLIQTDATLTGCMFTGNDSGSNPGGGIAVASFSSATLTSCGFTSNHAGDGGGVYVVGYSSATLTGCTFESNSANGNGGGIDADLETSLTVTDTVLRNNKAGGNGGGVSMGSRGALVLRSSTLAGNYANSGAGVYVEEAAYAVIEDCTIEDNGRVTVGPGQPDLVTSYGGGIEFGGENTHSLTRCLVRRNEASQFGGGVLLFIKSLVGITYTLDSCLISDNVSGYVGGGVYLTGPGSARLVNCSVVNNTARNLGGGLFADDARQLGGGRVAVDNSIFWGNTVVPPDGAGPQIAVIRDLIVEFSDVEDGTLGINLEPVNPPFRFDWQPSNLEVDPRFVNALSGDYHLSGGASPSPCIDAGNNLLALGLLDVGRHPRIAGCTVDMGAYEYAALLLEPPAPETDPVAKNRYISFFPGNPGKNTAVRVKLLSMHHPDPPNAPLHPAPDFSAFEGQVRWVGQAGLSFEYNESYDFGHFMAAKLGCTPYYWDWGRLGEEVFRICSPDSSQNRGAPCTADTDCGAFGTCVAITTGVDLLHVTGAEVVPSSVYEVQLFDQAQERCGDQLEGMFSAPLTIPTGRWGDVVALFQAPSPAPLSQPSLVDIVAVGSKFSYPPGWPIKVVAQLQGNVPDPNQGISELDISLCTDAVSGNAYPFPGPVACPCSDAADIRADLNGDGRIDAADDALEATTALYFVVNSDDLAEVTLSSKCPPVNRSTAWWSISWGDSPTDPALKVWLTADKSDGQGGAGTPITNGFHYISWPPPPSVWLEAVHSYNNIQITLTITDNTVPGAVVSQAQTTKTATLVTAAPCTRGRPRFWIIAKKSGSITGASAAIPTRPHAPLCSDTLPGLPSFANYLGSGISNATVQVVRTYNEDTPFEYRIWAQMGYGRHKDPLSFYAMDGVFAENVYGTPAEVFRVIYWDPEGVAPEGTHTYEVYQSSPLFGGWTYNLDGFLFWYFDNGVWYYNPGTFASWGTELLNWEDRMVGDPTSKCRFYDLRVFFNWTPAVSPALTQYDIKFDPPNPGWLFWGFNWVLPNAFEVWDKFP